MFENPMEDYYALWGKGAEIEEKTISYSHKKLLKRELRSSEKI